MKLRDFIEPILIGVPSLYIQPLKNLYRSTYGTNVCGTCGNLYLVQLVEYYAQSGLEVILEDGEVKVQSIKPTENETIIEGSVSGSLSGDAEEASIGEEISKGGRRKGNK